MKAHEKMLEIVKNVKAEAEAAERDYDFAAEMIQIKSSNSIDLFGGTAGSRVLEIASDSRKACDDLYASYQSLIRLLDEQCRPLLAELSEEDDAYAVKEVLEMIKWLNDESEIGTNFSASLNSASLGDLVGVKYHPSIENKMIEKYWAGKLASMPGAKHAESMYLENRRKEREAKRAAEIEERKREREREKRIRDEEKAAAEKEKKRRIEKEQSLKEELSKMRPLFRVADKWISMGYHHIAVRKEDGTVVAVGNNRNGQCNVSKWKNVIQVACTQDFTYGLTQEGRVLVAGAKGFYGETSCQNWHGIKQIAAGNRYLLGIDQAGNIHSTAGGPTQNDTVDSIVRWKDLKRIEANSNNVLAITKDGVLHAKNYNYYGRTDASFGGGEGLKDVEDFSAGDTSAGVIHKNGICEAYGGSGGNRAVSAENLSETGGLVKIKMVGNRPIGITYEKKVVIGNNEKTSGRADRQYREWQKKVQRINKPIVAVTGNSDGLLFLTEEGNVYFEKTGYGVDLKEGYLLGDAFRAFDNFEHAADCVLHPEKYEEERRQKAEAQKAEWKAKGLCPYCGGTFKKVLFGFKCTSCGRKKDF